MTDIQIEGATLTASEDTRVVSGLLSPFGETGKSNLGMFSVDAGAIKVPADVPNTVGLNVEHIRENAVGRALSVSEMETGLFASFRVADGPDGDQVLADVRSGARNKLSAEVRDVIVKGGKLVSGTLFGAAIVKQGAFPSATLLAAIVDTPDPAAEVAPATDGGQPTVEKHTEEITDADGVKHIKTTTTTTKVEGDKTTITEVVVITEPSNDSADPKEAPVGAATAPNTLTATGTQITTEPRRPSMYEIATAISDLRTNPAATEARTLLAALQDITIPSLTTGGAVPQYNWLGQLDQGDTYVRQYLNLGTLGTNITAQGKKGFVVKRGTSGAPVNSYASSGAWAGNKTPVFSGQGFTAPKTSTLDKFAIAEDIGREFYDLPGGAEAIIAFLALLDEDYAVWSDNVALSYWQQASGVPVAADSTIPAAYTGSLGMLIQGIIALKKTKADGRRDTPTFAILNDVAYKSILYTQQDLIPEYIKFSINTDGTGLADGEVLLVNGDTGIQATASMIIGAKKAIQFDELAGGPLHVDALNIANGGVDKAVHGYLQTFIARPEATLAIGTPDTRANTTAYTAGRLISVGAVFYRVTTAGTSGASAPTAPAVGATVADGTATLTRLV